MKKEHQDYQGRKRPKSIRKQGVPLWVWFASGGGLCLVLLIGGMVAVLLLPGLFTPAGPPAPPGYSTVYDREAGFQMFLPGTAKKAVMTTKNRQKLNIDYVFWSSEDLGWGSASVTSAPLPPDANPEQLEQLLTSGQVHTVSAVDEVLRRTPTKLGGKPALEVRSRFNPNVLEEVKRDPALKDVQFQNEGEHTVVCLTCHGNRFYLLKLMRKGQLPDDEMLRTIYDSFEFLEESASRPPK